MLTFAKQYYANHFSQQGEDFIIEEVLKRIGIETGVCAEMGAHNGKYCSNTYNLLQKGWKGIMIEADQELFAQCCSNVLGLKCTCINMFVTPDNVNDLVGKCDVLSIDCDGPDYGIWKAYTGKPAIVIIEINSSISPTDDEPVNSMQDGTAYKPMCELAIEKGYFVLCHTGNIIAIDNQYKHLFPEVTGDPVKDHHLYFNTSWL